MCNCNCDNNKHTIDVKFKRLRNSAVIPKRGSEEAAGYDLSAAIDYTIEIAPHRMVKIGTGLAITPPHGYFGAIFARSGLASKHGLRPCNCVGICDTDYTGEYIVGLYNDSNEVQEINPGDRIAQLVFLPYLPVNFIEVKELENTSRGDNGFGSTGINN